MTDEEREFDIGECCLTCINRNYRTGKRIMCKLDKKMRGERSKCLLGYEPSDNMRIMMAEAHNLHQTDIRSKSLLKKLGKDNDTQQEQQEGVLDQTSV